MKGYTRYSYVQARLQSRHGERPTAQEWKRLTAITSLSHFLQAARKGPLRRWLFETGPQSHVHEMELSLRRHFRGHIREVAGWMPSPWRPAVVWTRHLPDLPALAHLLQGDPAPRWIHDDPALKAIAGVEFDQRRRELAVTEKAPLLAGVRDEKPPALARAWYRHWRRLWPEVDRATAEHLRETAETVARARALLASARIDRSGPVLEALEAKLVRLFRRHTHEPATAFIHLALTGLLLERVRGALAVRILFPPRSGEAA